MAGLIKRESLADFGIRNITTYATEVNLDRAVPELYDGLKPVLRRVAWAMNSYKSGEPVKAAKGVGLVIGTYHPHGDSSVYGAMQTMVHNNVPLLEGIGNWGGLLDPAAAYRYTNCRLSKVGQSVFDTNYISVTDMVPNYDDTTKEPVVLPVRLPFLVLNGAEGIGVGITCSIPTFTLESTLAVLERIFKGEKLTGLDFAKTLKAKQHWGGHLVNTKENRQQWVQLMNTGRARVQFQSTLEVDEAKKTITINEWPGVNPEKLVQKVRLMPECQRAYNSKGSTTFTIECKKAYNAVQFKDFVAKVQRLATSTASYRFNCTHRTAKTVDGVTTYHTEFLALSVKEFFYRWAKLRLLLEKKSLEYQIGKQQQLIDYSNLLIYASTKLDVIFKALRQSDSRTYLVKHLKISEQQADAILDLKVRKLSKLDQQELKQVLKQQQQYMGQLKQYYKRPKAKIISEFAQLKQLVDSDLQQKAKRLQQKLVVK